MERNARPSIAGYLLDAVVALRKESVDRNTMRRDFKALGLLVALRKESVDRNAFKDALAASARGRSPQGERG